MKRPRSRLPISRECQAEALRIVLRYERRYGEIERLHYQRPPDIGLSCRMLERLPVIEI